MAKQVVVRMTPKQAKILWGVVDGALDAGACKDGLTKIESNVLDRIARQILSQIIPTSDDGEDE